VVCGRDEALRVRLTVHDIDMDLIKYVKADDGSYAVWFNGRHIGFVQKQESATRSYWCAWGLENVYRVVRANCYTDRSNWGPGKKDATRDNAVYDFFFGNR